MRIAATQESVLHVLRLIGFDTDIPCRLTLEQALTG